MCYAKPGPRCSNHAIKEMLAAKKAFEDALDFDTKEEAEKRLKEAERILDSTSRGQELLLEARINAKTPRERENYRSRSIRGARLHAQQETALLRQLPADTNVTRIDVPEIHAFVSEEGDVKYRLSYGGTVQETLPAETNSLDLLKERAWNERQAVPFFRSSATTDGKSQSEVYGNSTKVLKWEMSEMVNTTRVHEMLPPGYQAVRIGASDSNISDIAIQEIRDGENNVVGYIEVKMEKSQAGQIVVTRGADDQFTPSGTSEENPFTAEIMEIVNRQPEYLRKTTAGVPLRLTTQEQELVNNWFKQHYRDRGASMIAVTDSRLDYTALVPLEEVEQHAEIQLVMPRAKKSGSSPLPKKSFDTAREAVLSQVDAETKYPVTFFEERGRLHMRQKAGGSWAWYNKPFQYSGGRLLVSQRRQEKDADGTWYDISEVRLLGLAQNETVMFNFRYKGARRTQGKGKLAAWLRAQKRQAQQSQESIKL